MTFLVIVLGLHISCSEDDVLNDLKNPTEATAIVNTDLYEGGTQIENPYTVANMQRAMDTIKAKLE